VPLRDPANAPADGGIVIFQTAFPGDVILTAGLVRSIRDGWPDVPIAVVVRPDTVPIARMMDPGITVIAFDKRGKDRGPAGARRLVEQLSNGPWDHALLPHRSLRSAMVARSARLKPRIGFGLGPQSAAYTRSVPYRRGVHEVTRNYDLLVELARLKGWEAPPFWPPRLLPTAMGNQEARQVRSELGPSGDPAAFAVLAPGSVWETKRWPERYWKILARELVRGNLPVVWIGGEQDERRCARMAGAAEAGVVAAGRLSWQGTASLLSSASFLVSNDSAPVHMAGAVGCPTVALFGPTVPGFGFGALGEGSRSIGLALGCRPCRLHGGDRCPEGHFRCMMHLSPAQVVESVADMIDAVYGTEENPVEVGGRR
jgi:heptosyltransferase-2